MSRLTKKNKIAILGAGLAGLSAAYFLGKHREYDIYEKDFVPGGLCKTIRKKGFMFDLTGHLLHLHNPLTKKIILRLLKGNIVKIKKNAWIYSNGVYTKYPFQSNTYGLPTKEIEECLIGLIQAQMNPARYAKNFEEWIYNNFGKGVAKYFLVPYNEKLFRTPVHKITTDWISKYIPTPHIKDMIIGALEQKNTTSSYNDVFYYPKKGGINALVEAFVKKVKNITYNKEANKIDTKNKIIYFKDGSKEKYDSLVATIPLPELLNLIQDLPKLIKKLAKKLESVSVYNINFGVKGKNKSDKHWIYFPEKQFPFYRVGFQSNFSKYCVPKNCYSIYTEISYSKNKPLNKRKVLGEVESILREIGLIDKSHKIVTVNINDIKYAYVRYDKYRNKSLNKIKKYLEQHNIFSIGRFGSWEYSEIESAILESMNLLKKNT